MRRIFIVVFLAILVVGCSSSIPDRKALLSLVNTDPARCNAEVVTYNPTNQMATVRYSHWPAQGKTSAIQCQYNETRWRIVED